MAQLSVRVVYLQRADTYTSTGDNSSADYLNFNYITRYERRMKGAALPVHTSARVVSISRTRSCSTLSSDTLDSEL